MRIKPVIILVVCMGLLAFGVTALADTQDQEAALAVVILAKNTKAKETKVKKAKKGPNQNAIEHANEHAKFKRYEDYTPQEKEKIKNKTWDQITKEEQETISDHLKKEKDKLNEIITGKKKIGVVLTD